LWSNLRRKYVSAKNVQDEKQSRRRRRNEPEADPEDEDELVEERGLTERKGRATPGRRDKTEESNGGNFVTRPIRSIMTYLANVRSELQKVTWPTREQTLDLTRIVLITVIASAIVLGVISLIFSELFRVGLDTPVIMVALIVVASLIAAYYIRSGGRRTTY
jgi:preprotein translocase subunit SecE